MAFYPFIYTSTWKQSVNYFVKLIKTSCSQTGMFPTAQERLLPRPLLSMLSTHKAPPINAEYSQGPFYQCWVLTRPLLSMLSTHKAPPINAEYSQGPSYQRWVLTRPLLSKLSTPKTPPINAEYSHGPSYQCCVLTRPLLSMLTRVFFCTPEKSLASLYCNGDRTRIMAPPINAE